MLDRFGTLQQCFVHERRHKEVKRYGNQLQTGTAGVEKSLLRDVVLSHLEDLKGYGDDKLANWVKAPKTLCDAFAQYFRLPFLRHQLWTSVWANRCKRGDVCLVDIPGFGECVAELWFQCLYGDDTAVTMISKYEQTDTVNRFKIEHDETMFVSIASILKPCIYSTSVEGHVVIAPETGWPPSMRLSADHA